MRIEGLMIRGRNKGDCDGNTARQLLEPVGHNERGQKANAKDAVRAKLGMRFSKHHSDPLRGDQSPSSKQQDSTGLP